MIARLADGMRYELEQINRAQTGSEADRFTEGRYRQFARHLGSGFTGLALDVGCNTGRGGRALLTAASRVTLDGVELLADRIERIPAGVYRKVYRGRLGDVPAGAGPYDVLLMGELIEHVPFAALDDLIEQCTRLLARGGRLLLTTPNPHYALLRRRCCGTVLGGAHVSVHCPAALRQYLEWKGLRVETVSGSGPKSGLLGEKLPLALYSQYLLVARRPPDRAGGIGALMIRVTWLELSAYPGRQGHRAGDGKYAAKAVRPHPPARPSPPCRGRRYPG